MTEHIKTLTKEYFYKLIKDFERAIQQAQAEGMEEESKIAEQGLKWAKDSYVKLGGVL